ncbi:amidase [Halobacillus andaensis]|uniref:amidase n=1 Tax=Halobacillus andaensis TaxID=1176239 RepID=UPI003D70AECD
MFSPLATQGPISRNVEDAAFMMSVMSGPDNRSPISIEESGEQFLHPFSRKANDLRIAWSADLGGAFPIDSEIRSNIEEQMKVFSDLGCQVEEASPELPEADEVFHIFRAWEFEMSHKELFERYQEVMKPSFIWNFNKGRELRGVDIGRAERLRNELYHRMRVFFQQYDALILPVSQVPPFEVDQEAPHQINGVRMENYIDWMRSSYYISALGNPALSIPGGFTSDGLPIGLQIVGPHRADYDVLQIGYLFEQATKHGDKRPKISGLHESQISD